MAAHATKPADLDTLADDIQSLKGDFSALLAHIKENAVSGANGATSALGDEAQRLYDELAVKGKRSAKALGRQVEEQPILSLAIAFGIGFIGGRFLSR